MSGPENETPSLGPALEFGIGGDSLERSRVLDEVTANLFGAPRSTGALDRYVLQGRLGHGGFGQVLRARDPKLERDVALKLLRVVAKEQHANERLLAEARSLAALNHPNVVEVFDVGRYDSVPESLRDEDTPPGPGVFVVMELVEGPTLRQWIAAESRGWREVLRAFVEAGEGLAAAHAVGIVHRDFKLSNVMLGPDGRARVLDFGLARVYDPARESTPREIPDDLPTQALTESGTVMGTPAYMAPELLARERPTPQTDQYAYCVALWEALTGNRPFEGTYIGELRADIERQRPRGLKGGSVPRAVMSTIAKGLRVDPNQRHASVGALLEALRGVQVRRRGVAVLAGVAGLAGVSVVAALAGAPDTDAHSCARLSARAAEAVRGLEAPGDNETAQAFDAAVGSWRQRWSLVQTGVCRSPEADVRLQDARLRCLSHAVDEFERLGEALQGSDAATWARATGALGRLPDPHACNSPSPALPDDLEDRLAASRIAEELGHFDEALEHAESALEQASPEHRSIPLLRIGAVHLADAAYPQAISPLVQAYFEGQKQANDDTMLEAASRLIHANVKLAKLDEAQRWDRHAEAISARRTSEGESVTFLYARGKLLFAHKDTAAAETVLLRAEAELGEGEDKLGLRTFLAMEFARIEAAQDRTDRAQERLKAASDSVARNLGPAHPLAGLLLHERALLEPDLDIQIEMLRRTQAQLSSSTGVAGFYAALARANLAHRLLARNELIEAETLLRDAVPTFEAKLGQHNPSTGQVHHMMGRLLLSSGRAGEAKSHFADHLAAREATYGPDDVRVAEALSDLGQIHRVLHEDSEAVSKLERASEIFEAAGDAHRDSLCNALMGLGELAQRGDELARAKTLYERVLSIREVLYGTDAPQLGSALQGLASVASGRDDFVAAVALQTRATTLLEQGPSPSIHGVAWSLTDLAKFQLSARTPAAALATATRALEFYGRTEAGQTSVPRTRFIAAQAKWSLSRKREALRDAKALLEPLKPDSALRAEVEAWLRAHRP